MYTDKDQPRTIWIAFALSLVIHLAAPWHWLPRLHILSGEKRAQSESPGAFHVRLTAHPSLAARSESARERPRSPSVGRHSRPSKAAAGSAVTPLIAIKRRDASLPLSTARSTASVPVAVNPTDPIDARSDGPPEQPPFALPSSVSTAPPFEDSYTFRDRVITEYVASKRRTAYGNDPKRSGGIFQIKRLSDDHAEFFFFGSNGDVRRNTEQLIAVRKDNHADIRTAVVLKMMEIIREHAHGDFDWQSRRLGRILTFSTRPADSAALQDFLMQEFFINQRPARWDAMRSDNTNSP